MASVSELTCIYSALDLYDHEVMVTEEKINQRKKNQGSLKMTWALVFLTKPLLKLFNKKLNSKKESKMEGRKGGREGKEG
uniref:Uncharacterized protein n=1 Tax=Ailuropoda melanoleuca TaxID=9646 RepID=A0A7N5P771_AILME